MRISLRDFRIASSFVTAASRDLRLRAGQPAVIIGGYESPCWTISHVAVGRFQGTCPRLVGAFFNGKTWLGLWSKLSLSISPGAQSPPRGGRPGACPSVSTETGVLDGELPLSEI